MSKPKTRWTPWCPNKDGHHTRNVRKHHDRKGTEQPDTARDSIRGRRYKSYHARKVHGQRVPRHRCPTGVQMKKRLKLWMADWRDAKGKRHRKGFASKQKALRFQERMTAETKAKKDRASATSPRSATRGPRRKRAKSRTRNAASSPASSRRSQARSAPSNSPTSTSKPS